jgi:hypothetical protein
VGSTPFSRTRELRVSLPAAEPAIPPLSGIVPPLDVIKDICAHLGHGLYCRRFTRSRLRRKRSFRPPRCQYNCHRTQIMWCAAKNRSYSSDVNWQPRSEWRLTGVRSAAATPPSRPPGLPIGGPVAGSSTSRPRGRIQIQHGAV